MGRTACCVVLVCALVLTGCSGFGGGDGTGSGVGSGGEGESGVSVTPAPVPAAEGTERLAPGLTGEGVENASALASAHNAVLRNRSFTVRTNRTTTDANGSRIGQTTGTVRVVPDEMIFRATDETNGVSLVSRTTDYTLVRSERWFGSGRGLAAATFANGTTRYYQFRDDAGPAILRSYTSGGEWYAELLSGAETRVAGRVEHNGTTLYRLSSSNLSSSALVGLPWFESVGNGTFEALVGPQGFVHRHRLSYTATTENGSTVRVTQSRRYSEIGSTTVSQPAWYDEALNRTNATDG